jgi:hypothetical protein
MNYFNSHDRPPETIWAWHFLHEKQNDVMKGGWDNVKDHTCTEYTRTDISQARIAQLEAARDLGIIEGDVAAQLLVVAQQAQIEGLESALKSAMGALGDIHDKPEWPDDDKKELAWCRNRAFTTIAALKAKP